MYKENFDIHSYQDIFSGDKNPPLRNFDMRLSKVETS